MTALQRLRNLLLAAPPAGLASGLPLALSRVAVGAFFSISGFNKLALPDNRALMLQTIADAHIPFPERMAPFVAACEFAFGLLLAIGLGTRAAAAVLFAISSVALATVGIHHIPPGLGPFSWYSWLLYLPESLYLLVTLTLIVRGGERLSAAAALSRRYSCA